MFSQWYFFYIQGLYARCDYEKKVFTPWWSTIPSISTTPPLTSKSLTKMKTTTDNVGNQKDSRSSWPTKRPIITRRMREKMANVFPSWKMHCNQSYWQTSVPADVMHIARTLLMNLIYLGFTIKKDLTWKKHINQGKPLRPLASSGKIWEDALPKPKQQPTPL